MAQRVSRGENMLAKVGSRLGLTPEGREWLIGCLDPYHDSPLDICGFPDGSIDPVVTQIVRQSFNITCPTSITTGTWDCQIISLPFSKNIKVSGNSFMGGSNTNPTNAVFYNAGASTFTIGGLTYTSVPTGGSFNPNTLAPSQLVPNPIPDQYLYGNHRVIGKGFEVHNTTSVLNLQGMATTWAIPIDDIETAGNCVSATFTAGAASNDSNGDFIQIPMWPQNQAAAVLIPGSRQWTAAQGAYIVPKLRTNDVPINDTGFFVQPFINGGDSSNSALNLATIPTSSGVTGLPLLFPSVFWDNFDMHGVVFSGLSLQTTLTVNMTWLVERHPDTTISDLVVLARPPPERDNIAMELYTHISRRLPTGVPVGENGLGDWFMDALSSAADFVAPVLSVLPLPGASAIGSGIGALNAAYKNGKKKDVVVETNPYVAPPTYVTKKQTLDMRGVTNKKGKRITTLVGGSTKERVRERQMLANGAQRLRAEASKEARAARTINPFKGKSIPR